MEITRVSTVEITRITKDIEPHGAEQIEKNKDVLTKHLEERIKKLTNVDDVKVISDQYFISEGHHDN